MHDGLSIGEVSERTGIGVHALRYYEREGLLLGSVARGDGGRRRYSYEDVEWLRMCSRFRAGGMPLADIRRYTELVAAGPGNEGERLRLLREHEARVRAEMDALAESLAVIEYKSRLYAEHVEAGTASTLWTGETLSCMASAAQGAREQDRSAPRAFRSAPSPTPRPSTSTGRTPSTRTP
ncbi:MerR family transcriptional regulator [Kineosporia succinea]|uniref:DNA-binding transcriptional MerR regulator n=1 Tax=Kineosporia succinea TaxID=84632 RepID=A0ABT9PAU0_9ACTN|nr:MerR family transcriptional regulator [Kineosporia succinea]MDP9829773.1 DNA-binding transcriptional MerR regulator [Kineosporia succinea]